MANKRLELFLRLPCFLISVCLLASGCQKLGREERELLALGVVTAKERATSFSAMSPHIKARDAAEEADVRRYVSSHAEGLAAEAVALADFLDAANKSSLKDASVEALRRVAENARARARNWQEMAPKITGSGIEISTWDAFADAHQDGLEAVALTLRRLADRLKED